MKILRSLLVFFVLALLLLLPLHAAAQGPLAVVMTMSGTSSPATLEYL